MLLFKRHHQAPSPSNKLLVPTAKSLRALVPSLRSAAAQQRRYKSPRARVLTESQ
jgi:hypothetical protein